MPKLEFGQALESILAADPRYTRDAYFFVREGLDFTLKSIRKAEGATRHVRGKELLDGLRRHSLQQYGPMAKTVLNDWGINRCEDFAEIVFNLVDKGILGKTDQDSREDFKGGYTFDDAFVKPFLPPSRLSGRRGAGDSRGGVALPPSDRNSSGKESLSSGSN